MTTRKPLVLRDDGGWSRLQDGDVLVGMREKLTGDRTYYVRTDGSDSNTGLANTAGGAFATLQHAWEHVVSSIDMAGHEVTIQIANGTYAGIGDVEGGPNGPVYFQGNDSDPSLVNITTVSSTLVGADNCFLFYRCPHPIYISGVRVNTGDYTNAFYTQFSYVKILRLHWANSGSNGGTLFSAYAGTYVLLNPNTPLVITGTKFYSCVFAIGGEVDLFPNGLTLPGSIAMGFVFIYVSYGAIVQAGVGSKTGAATGKRYQVETNGIVDTFGGGASYFPGSVAGTTATGGQYL